MVKAITKFLPYNRFFFNNETSIPHIASYIIYRLFNMGHIICTQYCIPKTTIKKEAIHKYIQQSSPRESIQVNLKLHLMY